ncbi:MAG: radical SAM protein, partial [Candidatus Bathyarchaeia archaeon]
MDRLDREILLVVQEGIPLSREPFADISKDLGVTEDELIERLTRLKERGTIRRFGARIDQRRVGITANAVVVWKVPRTRVAQVAEVMSECPEISHCYERTTIPGRWEYNLFTVTHGYSKESVERFVRELSERIGITDYQVLFSTRKLKGESPSGMIRLTRLLHGTGTVSRAIMYRKAAPHSVPRGMIAFTETRRPMIFWNITNKCNLACAHCYIRAGPDKRRQDELSTEEGRVLIDDLAEMRVPLLMFTGGEPLVRQDFWELVSHARARGLRTAISTNGTMITKGVARRL